MNPARLEVRGLIVERPNVGGRSLRSRKGCKTAGRIKGQLGRLSEGGSAVGSRIGAACRISDRELIRLPEVGRILTQALRSLVPGRIVIDAKAQAEDGFVAAENLPGETHTRLVCILVHIDAGRSAGSVLARNQKLSRGGDVVRHPVID